MQTAALSVGLLSACSSRPENTQAEAIFGYRTGHGGRPHEKAISYLWLHDTAYPEMTELRGRLLKMRPSAMEGWTLAEIQKADCDMAYAQMLVDSLSKMFEKISDPKLVEAYYVHKKEKCQIYVCNSCENLGLMSSLAFILFRLCKGKYWS